MSQTSAMKQGCRDVSLSPGVTLGLRRAPSKPSLGLKPHSCGPKGTEQVARASDRAERPKKGIVQHRGLCPPRGTQTHPALRASGSLVMISPHPCSRHLCGWSPKLQSADVLIQPLPRIFSRGLRLICVVFSPSLLRQMAD